MSKRKTIPAGKVFAEWQKDPRYVAAYESLDEEFAIAGAIIAARAHAGLTQTELAKRMGTTQSVIARLEGGSSHPSTATLEKLAKATGTKLHIRFDPDATRA